MLVSGLSWLRSDQGQEGSVKPAGTQITQLLTKKISLYMHDWTSLSANGLVISKQLA